jgi:uncharacterized protein YqgC (DUF456 family)
MKIAKSTQRRVVALFVLVCLMLLPDLIISVLHVVIDKDWRTTNDVTLVGTMDVRRPSYMLGEGQQSLYTPTVIREATEDSPAIMAEPSQYIIYATKSDFEVDSTMANVRTVLLYILMVATIVLICLVLAVVYQAIRGFRTGEFFTRASVVMLRIMAVAYCVRSLIVSNIGALESSVASDLCGELLPEGLGGAYVLNTESIVVPLVLLIVAELMSIAHRLNEEESATL